MLRGRWERFQPYWLLRIYRFRYHIIAPQYFIWLLFLQTCLFAFGWLPYILRATLTWDIILYKLAFNKLLNMQRPKGITHWRIIKKNVITNKREFPPRPSLSLTRSRISHDSTELQEHLRKYSGLAQMVQFVLSERLR